MLKSLVVGALLLVCAIPCFAQFYAGASLLYTRQHVSDLGRAGFSYPIHEWYPTGNLFIGYASGRWAVELGWGPLSQFRSENISTTFDVKQDIKTKYEHVAVLGRVPFDRGFKMFGKLGISRVTMTNHEYGFNENGPNQDFRESSTAYAPIFGGGVTYDFRPVTLRAEVFWINNVARSSHAEHSDITAYVLGLQYNF